MSTVLHLGVRNVFRHPRRTGMTAGAVALGVVFMTVAAGFLDFTFAGLRDSLVYGGLGHLQLLPAAPREAGARLRPAVAADARRRLLAEPAVEHVAARLELQGLVSAGPRTVTFSGTGVEPAAESAVRALTTIRAGEWFTGRERMLRVLLGAGLAARLRVQPRDVVSVITYSDGGSLTAADVQVAGVFESGVIEYDDRALLMPLTLAQELLATAALSSMVVTVHDPAALDAITPVLHRALADAGGGARLVRWDELSPVYGSVVALYGWILHVFLAIVIVVVVLGIANTMSMAVCERVVEIGVLRALGFGARRVIAMLLVEAATIGGLGAIGGVALGIAACVGLTALGIAMPPPPGHSQGYVAAIHVVPSAIAAAVAVAVGSAVTAGVGPALRAVRREVADVLRAV